MSNIALRTVTRTFDPFTERDALRRMTRVESIEVGLGSTPKTAGMFEVTFVCTRGKFIGKRLQLVDQLAKYSREAVADRIAHAREQA